MSVCDLSIGFDSAIPLLKGIDLDMEPGERVAVTGPSGCGKTTLLRTLAGLIDPLAGAIRWREEPIGALGWPRYRREVMYVQHRPAMMDGTVDANLRRPFHYHVASAAFPETRAGQFLDRLRLSGGILDQEARNLSAGECLRVGLVRALLCQPNLLLLDEPTGALDDDSRLAVEDLLRESSESSGTSILVVTHQRANAQAWCDRVFDLTAFLASSEWGAQR